jgi:DNA polymerase III subunit delta
VDYTAFVKTAERGRLPPVVLIHGPDPQLLDDVLTVATRGMFPDPSLTAVGREVVDGREASADGIVGLASTLPLMTGLRLVVVRYAQAIPAKGSERLAAYLAAPSPTTCLLLLADESLDGGRDGRSHWLLRAVPPSAVVPLAVRRGHDLGHWLRQRSAAEGLEVTEEAARLLVEWVGDDTATLLGEVRKAALAGGSANRGVGVKEVTAVVGEHRVAGVFDLTGAIARRDVGLALRTLDRLLLTEEPMRLCALLTTDTRTLWIAHELGRRGQSAEQIARTVRRPPRVVQAWLADPTSSADLAQRLRRCWEVETRLKSSGDARAEMTALVASLASERA